MDPSTLETLRRLDKQATPGPWMLAYETIISKGQVLTTGTHDGDGAFCEPADAALIAAMRNALPALLDAAEAAPVRPTCATCAMFRREKNAHKIGQPDGYCCHASEAHPLHWAHSIDNAEGFGCTLHAPAPPSGGTAGQDD